MKIIWKGIGCTALCFLTASFAQAQEKDKGKDKDQLKPVTEKSKDHEAGEDRSDKEMNEKLSQDLYSRNPAAKDAVIVWDNNDEGFDGTYAADGRKYMTRYDRDGRYVETLVAREWDDKVPGSVRHSYDNSPYKSNKVERFWEVNEPTRRGYYLEIKDNDGNARRIWSDLDGNFSEPHK